MGSAMRLTRGLLVAGVAMLPLAAMAQQGPPPGYDGSSPPDGYDGSPPPPGGAPTGAPGGQRFPGGMLARFKAANTTGDGRLTLAQAQAAGLMPVVRHFAEIDADHKGFLTVQDLRAFHQRMKAERAAQQGGTAPGGPE